MSGSGLKAISIATVITLIIGFGLVFFWTPMDADQGFKQKIFYVHVPLSVVALAGFIAGGVEGVRHLRSNNSRHDLNSYVFIHLSVVFGVGALLTGAIWAKASWGHWWVWDEPTLVSFLIVFLLYCTYYPFRYAIEDRNRQARYASVFAITAGAFVPLNFMAVRMADTIIHPRVFATSEGGLPASMLFTFLVCLLGIGLLWLTLVKLEQLGKRTSGQVSRLRRALDADPGRRGSVGGRIAPSGEVR
ncbi:MAG: cytochrome c biogenesis protein CcsA [Solirubrobacterales bacterium]|nr:cytochrome c biogenesis protein CcsA [Solirubrobacterales bacterium]